MAIGMDRNQRIQVPTALAHRGRLAVLILLGAWLVHQLRYNLAIGHQSAEHSASHGHAYLDFTWPLLIGAAVIAVASWVFSLNRQKQARTDQPGFVNSWVKISLILIVLFAFQEGTEAIASTHHTHLLEGIFGSGGWVALPLSTLVGGVIALAIRGARAAHAFVSRTLRDFSPIHRSLPKVRRPDDVCSVRRFHVLASKLAGRAPPLTA